MNIVLLVIGIYLLLGIIALIILQLATHAISERLDIAASDTQSKLLETGNILKPSMAKLVTIIALWIFWVVAIYGALTPKRGKNGKSRD